MIQSVLLPNIKGLIDGQWIDADSGKTRKVANPADGSLLADVPWMEDAETVRAIETADSAWRSGWPSERRSRSLEALGTLLLEHKEELATIITREHGKTLRESIVEVEYSAAFFSFYATQVEKIQSHKLSDRIRDCDWQVHMRPAGVAGLITPWNFPLAMMAKKLAPALGAGCGIVIKPASLTPLSAIAFCTLAEKSGLPSGILNLVIGAAEPIGQTLCSHPAVRIISFTGSTEVGRKLAANAAPHIKRLTMELGGNAPFIIFDDANLDAAAEALMANKFRSSGQTCVCTNRVYVHRDIAQSFTEIISQRVTKLHVGNGIAPETDIGPLINRDGFNKVAAHVRDAIQRGATRLVGVDPPQPRDNWGHYYPPTVLARVKPEMLVCREETFGPILALSEFDKEDEVLALANSTEYGLAAYIFTENKDRASRLIPKLQFGHVGVNTGTGPTPEAPFGGMKQSGYGREGGLEGLLEFCEFQVVVSK